MTQPLAPQDGAHAAAMHSVQSSLSDLRRTRFCEEYRRHGNGRAAAQAAGYSPHTARQQASRLLTYADIRATIAELRAEVMEQNGIDRAELVARLDYVYLRAMTRGDYHPAIRTVEVQAKLCGLMPGRISKAEARLLAQAEAEVPPQAAPSAQIPEAAAEPDRAPEQCRALETEQDFGNDSTPMAADPEPAPAPDGEPAADGAAPCPATPSGVICGPDPHIRSHAAEPPAADAAPPPSEMSDAGAPNADEAAAAARRRRAEPFGEPLVLTAVRIKRATELLAAAIEAI